MENFAEAFNEFDSKSFMGKGGFVWWYGVVEDRNDPLFLGRVKVRCIGWHTDDKTPDRGIPTEDLPWADVINPITSASISGIGTSPTGIVPGTHVLGFFRDGVEAQEPVVIGTSGGVPERFANPNFGFFDPRSVKQRENDPYPPLFIQRTKTGSKATILNHPKIFSNAKLKDDTKIHMFEGENKYADAGYSLYVRKDEISQKSITEIRDKDDNVISSTISYSPHPDENRTRFNKDGVLLWSLPSTNMLASSLSKTNNGDDSPHPFSTILLRTHRINGQLEEYRDRLHSNIFTSNPDITFEQPGSVATIGEPVYPFNHVTYTESGHLFEMDDSPGKERLRILHRSTSNIEFLPTGDRVDTTIGAKYDMVDSNIETHALGNMFTNTEGQYDLYVGGRGVNDSYNVKVASGEATIATVDGDVNIIAGGKGRIVLKGTDVLFSSGDGKPVDQKTFNIDGQNFKGTNLSEMDFTSKKSRYHSDGETSVTSGSYNLTSNDVNITGNKSLSFNATMGSEEVVNGLLTGGSPNNPGYAKTVTTIGGKMQFNTVNPLPLLTGIEMNVGPNGELTKLETVATGLNVKTKGMTNINSDVSVDIKTLGTFTNDAKLSLTNKTALGQISIEETGKLKFESNKITLGTILAELMIALKSLSVTTGVGPSGVPINLSAFIAVENKLKQMLS
mgnify:CR=1 FL=1